MELTVLKERFEKIISKGTEDLDTIKAKDLKILNSSLVLSILFSTISAVVFLLLGLKVAAYITFFNIVPLSMVYLFNRSFEPKIFGIAISIFSIATSGFLLGYYGTSYGFHFLFLTSMLISLFNVKTTYFRRIVFFSSVLILMVLGVLYFYNIFPIAAPYKYGDSVNMFMGFICLFGLYHLAESYFKSLQEFEGKREKTIDSLIQKNEEITSFNHTVAHDLKEPLRAISSFSRLLFRNVSKDKMEDSIAYNDFIESGVSRMSQLLDDLMRFIETDDKTSIQTEIDLNKSLLMAEQNLVEMIKENNAVILKDELPIVKGNQSYCILLFQNLLNNALKFREPDRDPLIEISSSKLDTVHLIEVKDNGIGIESEYLDKIFSAFRRLHTKEQYEGSGLGLSLCKKILDFWEGSIEVESEFGKSTTFKIKIPNEFIVNEQKERPIYKMNTVVNAIGTKIAQTKAKS